MLWAAAMEKGYSCPLWLTYKQASELGGQVRKGEKGSLVVCAKRITKTATDDKSADVEIEIPFMKGYTAFNAEQIDGLPAHFYATVQPLNNAIQRLDAVERFFENTAASHAQKAADTFTGFSPRAPATSRRRCRRPLEASPKARAARSGAAFSAASGALRMARRALPVWS